MRWAEGSERIWKLDFYKTEKFKPIRNFNGKIFFVFSSVTYAMQTLFALWLLTNAPKTNIQIVKRLAAFHIKIVGIDLTMFSSGFTLTSYTFSFRCQQITNFLRKKKCMQCAYLLECFICLPKIARKSYNILTTHTHAAQHWNWRWNFKFIH